MAKDRRAEESSPIARESLLELIETIDAIVVILDAEGKIRYTNQVVEEITGYGREELEGENWFELLTPRDRYPEVWEEFQSLTAKGALNRFENPIVSKSGEERYIVWRNSVLRRKGKAIGTASIGIDISERKSAEKSLRDSEEKLLAVFMSVPVGIAVSDPEDGRIYDVNQEFERMFEYGYDDAVGKTSVELGLWADPKDRQHLVDLVEKEGRASDLELALRTASGRELTVHANALPDNGRRLALSGLRAREHHGAQADGRAARDAQALDRRAPRRRVLAGRERPLRLRQRRRLPGHRLRARGAAGKAGRAGQPRGDARDE